MLSLAKSAVHQQSAKLFQQHWRNLKGNYDLNSVFEKADKLLEQKPTGSHLYYNTGRQLTILRPTAVCSNRENPEKDILFVFLDHWSN